MLSEKMVEELNEQIKYEYFSAYYYLSMASWSESENLLGAAKFLRAQAGEEIGHGMKFFNYVHEQGCRVTLKPLDAPKADFKSLLEIFELSLEHEKFVTKRIYGIMDLAHQEKEYATISFLRLLVDEQVEEESSMDKIVKKIKLVGESGTGLLMIDEQLGKRADAATAK
jgi:ferritin